MFIVKKNVNFKFINMMSEMTFEYYSYSNDIRVVGRGLLPKESDGRSEDVDAPRRLPN